MRKLPNALNVNITFTPNAVMLVAAGAWVLIKNWPKLKPFILPASK
jgi:hypothetical protein